MSELKSNVFENQTGKNNSKMLPATIGGRVRILHGSFTPDEAAEAGTIIQLALFPKGARILPISQIHFEAGQKASLTIKVGDSSDAGRYLAAVSPGAAEKSLTLSANALGDYLLPEESAVFATTGGAALIAGKKISFDFFYVVD